MNEWNACFHGGTHKTKRLWQLTHIKHMMFNKIHRIFFLLQEQCFLVLKILHLIILCNLPVSQRNNLYYALCYLDTVFGVSVIAYDTTKAFFIGHSVSVDVEYNSSSVLAPGDKLQQLDFGCDIVYLLRFRNPSHPLNRLQPFIAVGRITFVFKHEACLHLRPSCFAELRDKMGKFTWPCCIMLSLASRLYSLKRKNNNLIQIQI